MAFDKGSFADEFFFTEVGKKRKRLRFDVASGEADRLKAELRNLAATSKPVYSDPGNKFGFGKKAYGSAPDEFLEPQLGSIPEEGDSVSEDLDSVSEEGESGGRWDAWILGGVLVLEMIDVAKTMSNKGTVVGGVGGLEITTLAAVALYKQLKTSILGGDRSALVRYTVPLLACAEATALAEHLAGWGTPVTGAGLGAGAQRVRSVGEVLAGADPAPSGWSGAAAHSYAGSNAAVKDLVATTAELDERLAAIVTRQAGQAEQVRTGLAGVKTALASGAVICSVWAAAAQADPTPATAAAFVKILSAVGFCAFASVAGLAVTGILRGVDNGREAAEIQRDYDALAGAASQQMDSVAERSESGG